DVIERINIEFSLANKLKVIDELVRVFGAPLPLARAEEVELGNLPEGGVIGDRIRQTQQLLATVRARWSWLTTHLDTALSEALPDLARLGYEEQLSELRVRAMRSGALRLVDVLQDRTIRASWKRELREPLRQIYSGRVFAPILEQCAEAHRRVLRGR